MIYGKTEDNVIRGVYEYVIYNSKTCLSRKVDRKFHDVVAFV